MVIVETIFIPQMLKGTRRFRESDISPLVLKRIAMIIRGEERREEGEKKKEERREEECNEAWYHAVAVEAGWVPTEFFSGITDLYFIHKNRRIYSFGYARF